MPPCHPSVPLIGKIPPIWRTLVLGGQLWQLLTVAIAKTTETINQNPDIFVTLGKQTGQQMPEPFRCTAWGK